MGAADQGAGESGNRWLVSARTLIFLTHGDEILLMKRNPQRRIFPGRYNGLGGHLERDEDPLAGAFRELEEEAGIRPKHLELRAIYHVDPGGVSGVLVFIFSGESPTRELPPTHSDEGELRWLPRSQLPQLDLVEDLPLLLTRILNDADEPAAAPLFAHLSYDDADRLLLRFHDEAAEEDEDGNAR